MMEATWKPVAGKWGVQLPPGERGEAGQVVTVTKASGESEDVMLRAFATSLNTARGVVEVWTIVEVSGRVRPRRAVRPLDVSQPVGAAFARDATQNDELGAARAKTINFGTSPKPAREETQPLVTSEPVDEPDGGWARLMALPYVSPSVVVGVDR